MSKEAVIQFREALNANESMQREVRALEKLNSKALSALAGQHGFECTPEEVALVSDTIKDELTEFELEVVTGGVVSASFRQGMRAAETVGFKPESDSSSGDDDDDSC